MRGLWSDINSLGTPWWLITHSTSGRAIINADYSVVANTSYQFSEVIHNGIIIIIIPCWSVYILNAVSKSLLL